VLYWVDISGQAVFSADASSEEIISLTLEQPVTAVLPEASGGLVVSCGTSLIYLKPDFSGLRPSALVEPYHPRRRCNSGGVDPTGFFWMGVMDSEAACGEGCLYRINPGTSHAELVLDKLALPNGMGWSSDGRTFFLVDSIKRTVAAYDFEPAAGQLLNRRVVVKVPDSMGLTAWRHPWQHWNGDVGYQRVRPGDSCRTHSFCHRRESNDADRPKGRSLYLSGD